MTFATSSKPELGAGIYTLPDVATILKVPYDRVLRCVKDYWDIRFAVYLGHTYSWNDGKSKAVSFQVLVELFVFFQLSEAGVLTKKIIEAHEVLSKNYNTSFPFAHQQILKSIRTDGSQIFFKTKDGHIISLDGKRQLNLGFLEEFFKNIDFGSEALAVRLWPSGRKSSILIDPGHCFGQPIINGTNIRPETIFQMHKGGDSIDFIADIYGLSVANVKDSIAYCQAA